MTSLIEFMNSNRANNALYTHVSLINPKGKFFIDRKNKDLFFNKYCNDYKNKNYGIAERPEHYIPVLCDIDLKSNTDTSLYDSHFYEKIIKIYQSTLSGMVKHINQDHLTCVLLEKERYKVKEGLYKNGFHLHFPFIFLSKQDHENFLIPEIKKQVKSDSFFNKYNVDELVDDGYTKAPWLLYGSVKKEEYKPYKISKIFDFNYNELTISEAFIDYCIYDSEQNKIILTEDNLEYNLPRIFSTHFWARTVYMSEIEETVNVVNRIKMVKTKHKTKRKYINNNNLKLAEKLLSILNQQRVEDHNDWMMIGWALYNISGGTDDGYNIWINYTKTIKCNHKNRGRPGDINEDYCYEQWDKMLTKNITIGTLKYLAKNDNPVQYDEIIKQEMSQNLENSINIGGSHYDIAKALFDKYGSEYVCSSLKYKTWYKFENHIWVPIEEGTDLRKKISTEIVRMYRNKVRQIEQEMMNRNQQQEENDESSDTDDEIDVRQEQQRRIKQKEKNKSKDDKIETIYKMLGKCKSAPFKKNVMTECMEIFFNPNFDKLINSNKYLIAFQNGVYDLKANTFREGYPHDYISLKLGVEYTDFNENDQSVLNVKDFINKVFPDKSVRKYFMDTSCNVFVGGNFNKHVLIWSGEGDNAKSVTESLFEKMLGDYAKKLPTSLITGKRTASSAASPELSRAGNGCRWAVLQEPDKKDVINIGILKELSGNDTFYARDLFQSGREITPMFKLVMVCNEPPQLPNSDKATWNRIRVIPFEATFSFDAPAEYEEQLRQKTFPRDENFDDKIPGMINAFAWVLLEYRKNNPIHKLIEPEKVKLATNIYKKRNDIYRQFVDECIKEQENCKISIPDLYTFFKDWFKESLPNHSVPIKNEVREYFERMWGETGADNRWKGYRFVTTEENIQNGDMIELDEEDLEN